MIRLPLLLAGVVAVPAAGADPKPLKAFDAVCSFTYGGGFSDDGKQVIGIGGRLARVDLDTGKELPLPDALKGQRIDGGVRVERDVWLLSLRQPSVLVERDGRASRFVLFDFATETITADWTGHADTAGAVAYLPASNQLVTAGDCYRDHTVRFWDHKTQKEKDCFDLVKELKLEPKDEKDYVEMRRMAADSSGNLLAFGFDKGMIQVRDLKAGKWREVQADLRGAKDGDFKGRIERMAFAGEKLLAVRWRLIHFQKPKLTTSDVVEVFDWEKGEVLYRLTGKGRLSDPAVSPGGKLLAVGDDGGVVRVYDAAEGGEVGQFRADAKGVSGVLFRDDGKRVVTVGSEGVKVWDAAEVMKAVKR